MWHLTRRAHVERSPIRTFKFRSQCRRFVPDPESPSSPKGEEMKKFEGPVSIERSFKVDGKKLTVMVTFPATVVQELGMEQIVMAANRAIVSLETKNHAVDKFR